MTEAFPDKCQLFYVCLRLTGLGQVHLAGGRHQAL